MDDKKLQDILKNQPAPSIDKNAKKRALNLANAAFAQEQKKNQKTSQGFVNLLRLIGITNTKTRNETMESKKNRRFIYGGMATAMAVIVVVGLGVNQLDDAVERFENQTKPTVASHQGQNFGSIALNIKQPPNILEKFFGSPETIGQGAGAKAGKLKTSMQDVDSAASSVPAETGEVSPAYIEAIEQKNRENMERAVRQQQSASPLPVPTGGARLREEKPTSEAMQGYAEPAKKDFHQAEVDSIAPMPTRAQSKNEVAKRVISPSSPPIIIADDIAKPQGYQDVGRDKFEEFKENSFKLTTEEPVSTFSSDVDTASYSFMRKSLNNGVLPQKNAVRIEELINYFDYDYAVPESKAEPFKPTVTVTDSPWAENKKLMHIGIKGYEITDEKPRSNLVFLLDVSGSMNSHDKLPLLKNSLKLLLDTLGPEDTVAIAVYAGAAGTVLEPTKVADKHKIISALDRLNAGGSTAGAAGIRLAYDLAQENFDEDAVNRVILATDGDFNVGITNKEELKGFVERKRQSGVFLSVLGFGRGNYNDHMMQTLAQNGNGVAAYIDSLNEARKVLVEEASSSLFPIAKDVKFQIEFNPTAVAEYRLIGYETRSLKREDFNNDKVDAGDIGAGHSVTAIYEFTPSGGMTSVDPLRYGSSKEEAKPIAPSDELAFLKIRYKLPNENTSKLITTPITFEHDYDYCASGYRCEPRAILEDTDFATAVAAFGQIIKGGAYTGAYSLDDVIALAQAGKGTDEFGYRSEFIQLVRLAKSARAQ